MRVGSYGGALMALGSGALFGASTPLAKLLLGQGMDAWLLAGLSYLGSGVGLALLLIFRRLRGVVPSEAPLRRPDLPWLGLATLAGGVIGPILLMVGLARTPASSAALLLNVEGLASVSIAWLVFGELVNRRLLAGVSAILAGAALLSWQGGPAGFGLGALAIVGACFCWGLDNNATRKLSSADPIQITMIKGLVAGSVVLVLFTARGVVWPPLGPAIAAAIIGFFCYGLGLILFVLALAILMFREPVTAQLIGAVVLMGIGLYLQLGERHEHEHAHEAMSHAHRHVHDEHHRHEHGSDDLPGEPHTHTHEHLPLTHRHPHFPDLHHRHGHAH